MRHRKRCVRYDVRGHAHYLTFSCFRRQPLMLNDRVRRWFCEAAEAARRRLSFDLWAYVLMPEHVHLLVYPRDGATVSRILMAIKQPVAQRALHLGRRRDPGLLAAMTQEGAQGLRSHRLWQRGGGYDHNIWSLREIHKTIRYIHANPVRRGLVDHPSTWHWSSWSAWHLGCDGPLRIDRETVPTVSP